jgi:hypothetical protein
LAFDKLDLFDINVHTLISDLLNGFNTKGLFRFCRHPNFFAEQGLWVCIWLFSLGTQHPSLSALFDSLKTWATHSWETKNVFAALEGLFSQDLLNERYVYLNNIRVLTIN